MRQVASIVLVTGAIGLILSLSAEARAAEPAGKNWIGKSVFPKQARFRAPVDEMAPIATVEPGEYGVKEAKGSSLLLERSSGVSGWVEADQVCRSRRR